MKIVDINGDPVAAIAVFEIGPYEIECSTVGDMDTIQIFDKGDVHVLYVPATIQDAIFWINAKMVEEEGA